jgi:hypothetical protein
MYTSHATHRAAHPANGRLIDLLDQVRQEFDTQNGRAGEYEQQRKFALWTFRTLHMNGKMANMQCPTSSIKPSP